MFQSTQRLKNFCILVSGMAAGVPVCSKCLYDQVIGSTTVDWISVFGSKNVVAIVYGLVGLSGVGFCFVILVGGTLCMLAYRKGPDCSANGIEYIF